MLHNYKSYTEALGYPAKIPKWKQSYLNELDAEPIGYVLQPIDVFEFITTFSDDGDYDDSNWLDRCNEYDKFVVEFIDIDKIELDRFYLNEDKLYEYMELYENTKRYPTIVVSENENGYDVIDGNHRANALKKLGLKKIKAYIGKNVT